jgi:peptidoglycan hydrolase-like protein with peptidoglycan-binding domain
MDEGDYDFEFDFFPEHSAATADTEEELHGEETSQDRPQRRPAGPPAEIARRRRIAVGIAAGLVLLIILVVVLTSGGDGGGGGPFRSYVNQVSTVVGDSQQAGASLGSLTEKNAVSRLDALIQGTTTDINRLQALTPPKELTAEHAQALAALDLRLLGLQGLRDAAAQSQAGATVSPDAAVTALLAGDRLWESSVRTPANSVLLARGLPRGFPRSTFISDPKALRKSLGTLLGSPTEAATGAVLSLDSKGPDVVAWQKGLNQWITATGSPLAPLTADGTFGPSTRDATIALQNAQGLAPDGVVGPSTRETLQKAIQAAKTSTAATLKLGDTGEDVVAWQQKLNQWLQLKAPTQTQLATDGSFGDATRTATEQLQTAAGLTPTGEVDARTRQALATALANGNPNRG